MRCLGWHFRTQPEGRRGDFSTPRLWNNCGVKLSARTLSFSSVSCCVVHPSTVASDGRSSYHFALIIRLVAGRTCHKCRECRTHCRATVISRWLIAFFPIDTCNTYLESDVQTTMRRRRYQWRRRQIGEQNYLSHDWISLILAVTCAI